MLREARRKRGWSILHLSQRSGVSWEVIEQIEEENPHYAPPESNTALLAKALRVSVGSLLTERDGLVERLPH